MRRIALLALAVTVVASLAAALGASGATDRTKVGAPIPAFSAEEIAAPSGDNFIAYGGNGLNHRYSTLDEINVNTVKNLKIRWQTRLQVPGKKEPPPAFGVLAEQSPVVYDGMIYMPDYNRRVWAINAATGEKVWATKPRLKKLVGLGAGIPNRGVAIGEGKVFIAASDASVIAMSQATGRILWRTVLADNKKGDTFTSAPAYADGKLFLPGSGGDSGASAKVWGVDAKTGKKLWTFNVVPQKPSDPGWNTWSKDRIWRGGGAIFNTPAVDPELNQVVFSTGNGDPYSGLGRGPGKELYIASIVSLDMDTGKLKWHFQMVHHDIWDYACPNPVVLFDLERPNGTVVKGAAEACKTGMLYLVDRRNGKPLYGIPEKPVPQSAAQHTYPTQPFPVGDAFSTLCPPAKFKKMKGPDKKPYRVGCIFEPYDDTRYTVSAPGALGGANWPPSSFSPDTGYMYICSKDSLLQFKSIPLEKQKLVPLGDFSQVEGLSGGGPAGKMTGRLVAMNLRNNRIAWQQKWPELCYSGVLSTAGNLVFVGRSAGFLEAYNARNGRLVWRSPKLRAGVNAAPVTYTVEGKQYVSVFAGGSGIAGAFGGVKMAFGNSLYTFALPD